MAKKKRSNKWAFLIYQDSVPDNYLDILEELHIPFILSPWHNRDVNKKKQEGAKKHINMVLSFLNHSKATAKYLSYLLKN